MNTHPGTNTTLTKIHVTITKHLLTPPRLPAMHVTMTKQMMMYCRPISYSSLASEPSGKRRAWRGQKQQQQRSSKITAGFCALARSSTCNCVEIAMIWRRCLCRMSGCNVTARRTRHLAQKFRACIGEKYTCTWMLYCTWCKPQHNPTVARLAHSTGIAHTACFALAYQSWPPCLKCCAVLGAAVCRTMMGWHACPPAGTSAELGGCHHADLAAKHRPNSKGKRCNY